jgi:hypothetical protein
MEEDDGGDSRGQDCKANPIIQRKIRRELDGAHLVVSNEVG